MELKNKSNLIRTLLLLKTASEITKFISLKTGGKYNFTPNDEPVNKLTIDGNDSNNVEIPVKTEQIFIL